MAAPFESPDVALGDLLSMVATGKIQLPDFQQEWKWDTDRIASLIGSTSRLWRSARALKRLT